MVRVVYDPQADAAMVYIIEGIPIDHWDVAADGLVLGLTSDGRVAQCELWSITHVGFEHYKDLPLEAKDELRRLTQPNSDRGTLSDLSKGG